MLKNKNKLKIIALIAMLILALTLPIVRADDEPVANTEVTSPEATAENISTDMPQPTYLFSQTMLPLTHKLVETLSFVLVALLLENKAMYLVTYLPHLKMLPSMVLYMIYMQLLKIQQLMDMFIVTFT